jgi:predicted esterase
MFRADSKKSFKGPHQQIQPVFSGQDTDSAPGAMIMIHGRGATAESIIMLADEFGDHQLHLAAPQASQFQWYPYSFLAPTERNEPGLSSGLQAIHDIRMMLNDQGLPDNKILFLGFSQGACLASEYVARHPSRYGGLIVFSGGLIGDQLHPDEYSGSLDGSPVFMGCSDIDPHIPEERVHESAAIFEQLGANVRKKIYPGMGHTVNEDEIQQAAQIIQNVISS